MQTYWDNKMSYYATLIDAGACTVGQWNWNIYSKLSHILLGPPSILEEVEISFSSYHLIPRLAEQGNDWFRIQYI